MDRGRTFYVPAATPNTQEQVYSEFARWCRCEVPEANKRISSISFIHEGVTWSAKVGEPLCGTEQVTSRSKGKKVERTLPRSDPAIVLAIFSGNPFMVVTNHRIGGNNVGSAWENPFMAGRPLTVTYFAGVAGGVSEDAFW